ncbi:MAG: recombinase family protein [Bacteroidota bacterium]
MKIGYARVSTSEQSHDLQIDALHKAGCEKIYAETASGAKTSRPDLDALLEFIREGDTLVVWKLDRLGRSMSHLLSVVEALHQRGVGFICLAQNIDTTTPTGKLIFHIFGALAEFEKGLIQERTKAGLKAARARGRMGGRPSKLNKKKIEMMRTLYESKELSVKDICAQFKISTTTFYRHIKQ